MLAPLVFAQDAEAATRFVADDPRADGGQRRISIAADKISIDRRVAGVAMRLALPIACFRGVSLAVVESGRGTVYRVALDHVDPELRVTLAEAASEGEIAPEWRAWAEFFQLPRMTRGPGESHAFLDHRLGALDIGAAQPRKRGWPLKHRRSAMSGRRDAGPRGRVQAVYRDEREIICYE